MDCSTGDAVQRKCRVADMLPASEALPQRQHCTCCKPPMPHHLQLRTQLEREAVAKGRAQHRVEASLPPAGCAAASGGWPAPPPLAVPLTSPAGPPVQNCTCVSHRQRERGHTRLPDGTGGSRLSQYLFASGISHHGRRLLFGLGKSCSMQMEGTTVPTWQPHLH